MEKKTSGEVVEPPRGFHCRVKNMMKENPEERKKSFAGREAGIFRERLLGDEERYVWMHSIE